MASPSPDLRLLRVLPAALPRRPLRRHGGAGPRRPGPSGPRRREARSSRRSRSSRRRPRRRCPSPRALFAGLVNGIGYVGGHDARGRRDGAATSPIRRTGSRGSSRRARSSPTAPVSPGGSSRRRSSSRRSPSSSGRARAVRGVRPGVHGALAIWGAVTLFLALSQRLNVYYAAPLAALALVEAARFASTRIRRAGPALSKLPRRLVGATVGLVLALPMAPGLRGGAGERAASRAPTSSRRSAGCATKLPHAIDAYDPRPARPAALSRERSRRASVGDGAVVARALAPLRGASFRSSRTTSATVFSTRSASSSRRPKRTPSRSPGGTARAGSSRRTSCRA